MSEIGTLKGLKVKPGDLVECVEGWISAKKGERYLVNKDGDIKDFESDTTTMSQFRIISRAPDKPRLWRDMTPEEKGALLLAYHEGKVIENKSEYNDWIDATPFWVDNFAYRVKPDPVVKAVTLYAGHADPDCFPMPIGTITLIDGKPDLSSIKMEKLGE